MCKRKIKTTSRVINSSVFHFHKGDKIEVQKTLEDGGVVAGGLPIKYFVSFVGEVDYAPPNARMLITTKENVGEGRGGYLKEWSRVQGMRDCCGEEIKMKFVTFGGIFVEYSRLRNDYKIL